MSEPIWANMRIGGTLAEHFDVFVNAMQEFSDGFGGDYESIFATHGEPYNVQGNVNYGAPDETKAFCQCHDLPYDCTVGSSYEYTGEYSFWIPGMKKETCLYATSDGNPVVDVEKARNLLTRAIKAMQGKNKTTAAELLKQRDKLCPALPKIPNFEIPEDILPTLIGMNPEADAAIAKRLKG